MPYFGLFYQRRSETFAQMSLFVEPSGEEIPSPQRGMKPLLRGTLWQVLL